LADPVGYVVLLGDMINNGIKHGKSNVYKETMSPFEQKLWLTEALRPFTERLLGAVRGNHEERSAREVDDCPMYDVMASLGIPDLYRENAAFLKVNIGQRKMDRQVSYGLFLGHGVSKSKTQNFGYSIDGLDIMITGHTHDPNSTFPAKIVMDMHNETVKTVGFKRIVVPSFDEFGGYVLKGMYMPQDSMVCPKIILDGTKKKVGILWE